MLFIFLRKRITKLVQNFPLSLRCADTIHLLGHAVNQIIAQSHTRAGASGSEKLEMKRGGEAEQ